MSKEVLIPDSCSPDALLYQTLEYLRSLPPEKRTAVVAGIYCRNENHLLVATSYQYRDPITCKLTWNHAEHEVLSSIAAKDKDADGKLIRPDSFLLVSTLSPCARPSSTRAHVACIDLLTNTGIRCEHTGKIDTNAAKTNRYEELQFVATVTSDPVLLAVCHELYTFFIPYKKKGMNKTEIINRALRHLPSQLYIQVPDLTQLRK